MLSIGLVTSAGAASRYFDKDNYYAEGETSPSAWFGTGAVEAGLKGPVAAQAFAHLLEGHVPGRDQRIGYANSETGAWTHQAGWDLTFSAPKSVTLLALLGGDRRIIAAHDRAVTRTLAAVEAEHATTRIRQGGVLREVRTGHLTAAVFRHDLNRLQEPQLHSHAVVANMTKAPDGRWRALHSRPIYRDSKTIGMRYQQELALEMRGLGYAVEPKPNGTFEVRGVGTDLPGAFSSRRAEVVAWLAARGIDPERATQAETRRAALATRRAKTAGPDRAILAEDWRATAGAEGLATLAALVEAARARTPEPLTPEIRAGAADALLARAIATLAEREAAWTRDAVLAEAGRLAPGQANAADLETALARLETAGTVVARAVTTPDPATGRDVTREGRTLAADQAREARVIALGTLRVGERPILRSAGGAVDRAARADARTGAAWNTGQVTAARQILESRAAVTGLQGLAGTAKTTTVLKTVAETAARKGFLVTGLAPTASAADGLGRAIGVETRTVASHLLHSGREAGHSRPAPGGRAQKALWIVDEASLLATRQMEALLDKAATARARVLLVGDVHQLGAVEAGAPFRQLQEAGMPTAVLDRILRQRDPGLRRAIADAAAGRVAAAMAGFERAGGALAEIADPDARLSRIARDYAALSAEARDQTLVIEPSVAGRARLNAEIRALLVGAGALGPKALPAETLRRLPLTRAEAREPACYTPGSLVRFRRAYRLEGGLAAKGQALVVTGTQEGGLVTLRRGDGRDLAWRPGQKGAGQVTLYARDETDLRAGDRIRWQENATIDGKALRNGQIGTVARIDPARGIAVVRFAGSGMVRLDAQDPAHRFWSHAYAETAHAAQGRTAERVLVHAESHRINLVNQRSLYVALSRARAGGVVYTDDRAKLLSGAGARAGASATAADPERLRAVQQERDRTAAGQKPDEQRGAARASRQAKPERTENAARSIVATLERRIRALLGPGQAQGQERRQSPEAPGAKATGQDAAPAPRGPRPRR